MIGEADIEDVDSWSWKVTARTYHVQCSASGHWSPYMSRQVFTHALVLLHRCLTGVAPRYLTELAVPVTSTAHRRLRSVSSADLVVPSTCRSTIGDRAFTVAGPRAWNSLPSDIRTSTLFNTFKKHLKSYLFQLSFSSL